VLDSYALLLQTLLLQTLEMIDEFHRCAESGNLERVRQLVEGGVNIEGLDEERMTALSLASLERHFEIVVYLVEHGANVAHTDFGGRTALHWAAFGGNLPTVKYLVEHGARITERSDNGKTALLFAAENGSLGVIQFLLSPKGGASISETDIYGNTALLLAAGGPCRPAIVHWLLEYGGAQIGDTDNEGKSVWALHRQHSLPNLLKHAYAPNGDVVELTAMLRVMLLHSAPPETLTEELERPLQRIVQDGARLRARLPVYLVERRALLDAHCPLLPPLQALVHGYEEPTTTDELWATGLGAHLQCVEPVEA
jgi:hypothetical protein